MRSSHTSLNTLICLKFGRKQRKSQRGVTIFHRAAYLGFKSIASSEILILGFKLFVDVQILIYCRSGVSNAPFHEM